MVGVASSHPYGILALKKASISLFDEDFIKTHLARIVTFCNIKISHKRLLGTLFQPALQSKETTSSADQY